MNKLKILQLINKLRKIQLRKNQLRKNQLRKIQIKNNPNKKNTNKKNTNKKDPIKNTGIILNNVAFHDKKVKKTPVNRSNSDSINESSNNYNNKIMSVVSTHNAGFFSCCSVKLNNIVDFINKYKKIPDEVDSSHQFNWYKKSNNEDITFDYFKHYDYINNISINYPINYKHEDQFTNYSNLDYDKIIPIVKKYFSPSNHILIIIRNIEQKYNINYDNTCVLFYRGNDKITETNLCSYNEYLIYANLVIKNNPNIIFLIQSDETEFIEFMKNKFPNNSIYFKDEIRHMSKCNNTVDIVMKAQNYEFSKYYLGITIIMSRCKYIICGSGNCSIWIMLYRGNNKNVYQNLNNKWIIA
jgi:hypothetical protein